MKSIGILIGAFVFAIALATSNITVFANSCCGIEKSSKESSKEDAKEGVKAASADQVSNNPCAVCGKAVECKDKQVDIELGGKTTHLCCQGCADEFNKNPDKYSKVEKTQRSS